MSPILTAVLLCLVCLSTAVTAAEPAEDELPAHSGTAADFPVDDPAVTATCEQIVDASVEPDPGDRQQRLSQCIADAQQFLHSVNAGE